MSVSASFARRLQATTSLVVFCFATPAFAQYVPAQRYTPPGQYPYGGTYTAPPARPGAIYYQAQVAPEADLPQVPEVPAASPSDLPLGNGGYTLPPPGQVNGGYPQQMAPNGSNYNGANYHGYNPTCQCADGGYSTWGLWSGYSPTSPCSGGAGCGWGGCGLGWGQWFSGYGLTGQFGGCGNQGGCAPNALQSSCCAAPCRHWFGGVYGLYMDHDDENEAWTSFDSSNIANQVLSSHDASVDWQAGNEIRVGSTFLCHPYAWEVVYWGLYEESDQATVTAAGIGAPVSTVLDFGGLDYDDGMGVSGVNSYFDNAQAHRVRRHFELQNVEINLIKFPMLSCVGPCGVSPGCGNGCTACAPAHSFGGMYGAPGACGPRFTIVGIAGVRYMRLDDGFEFATSLNDTTIGDDPEDMFYQIEMENHLIGAQLGAAANFQATNRVALYADSKFGIYANHIEHSSRIFGSNGFAVVTGGLPFAGEEFNIQSEKDDIAFLGELRVGTAYWVRPNWRLYGGWRAVGVTGIALPTEQIPLNFAGTPDVRAIDSNGSMIIHGLEAGVEVSF